MTEIDWSREAPGLEVLEGEPLARHTTFRVGGPARWFLAPKSPEETALALKVCARHGVRPFCLGNGSNLLAPDGGYDGVILSTAGLDRLERRGNGVYAGSGVLLPRIANFAADAGLAGLEFAQGIPGSAGGAARMNAGAYGGEMVQVVEQVDYLDETGERRTIPGAACEFSYRHSIFCEKPWLITGVLYQLSPGDPEELRARMAELGAQRRAKQPLEWPSAGSAFKRPPPKDGVARYAAALIDQCGLKGFRVGDAQVSEKHAGFVVNLGAATAAQVRTLLREVRDRVLAQTGVALEPEVEILGEKEGL